jgi:hypothetical protein
MIPRIVGSSTLKLIIPLIERFSFAVNGIANLLLNFYSFTMFLFDILLLKRCKIVIIETRIKENRVLRVSNNYS